MSHNERPCERCRKIKPIAEFPKLRDGRLRPFCNSCTAYIEWIAWTQRALHNCAIPPVPGRGRVFLAQRKDVMTYMRHYVATS